jgi:2-haloacid dehalogenase
MAMPAAGFHAIQVLLFDTFGTTVDWRGSLIAHLAQFGRENGRTVDWAGLADAWRARYKPAIQLVSEGKRPWANFDVLHRETLDELLPEFELATVSDAERAELVRGWEVLKGWPDTVAGLTRLKRKFIVGSLSNGNVRQLTNMAKFAGLPWDVIVGADIFHHYKPEPGVYRGAVELLACPAEAVLMVAAHNDDLKAARENGMKTAFVRRPTEEAGPNADWEFVAKDFEDLADQLGA